MGKRVEIAYKAIEKMLENLKRLYNSRELYRENSISRSALFLPPFIFNDIGDDDFLALEATAKRLVYEYLERNPYTMTKPSSLARGAVYIAGKLVGVPLRQVDVDEAMYGRRINHACIRKAYREIKECLKIKIE
jgi:hypothetical protein